MSFTANGLSFSSITTGVTPTTLSTGKFHDVGLLGPAPMASRPLYEDKAITFPGIDGVVNVRHGFRGRLIFATLIWAGATASAVNAAAKADLDTLSANTRYTVAIDGASYDGCKIQDAGHGSFINMSGGVLFVVPCIFSQLSLTN